MTAESEPRKLVLSTVEPTHVEDMHQILEILRRVGREDATDGVKFKTPDGGEFEVVKLEGGRHGVVVYLSA